MGEQHEPVPVCSLNEWVVLCLLAEGPAHGFALAKALAADSDLGRILTVRRPLAYRALDRLVQQGLAQPHQTEPGDAGPTRTVHRITDRGAEASRQWLVEPVGHVRDLRVEFLVKLRLLQRRGLAADRLVAAQRDALGATLDRLISRPGEIEAGVEAGQGAKTGDRTVDVVDLWRANNAAAAAAFLDQLDGC